MEYQEVDGAREYVARLEHGRDWRGQIEAFAAEEWLGDERFAHTHAVLSREDGTTIAGHLEAATTFAGELYVREFDASLVREHDSVTDLDLWPL